jgi:hypothetical protein
MQVLALPFALAAGRMHNERVHQTSTLARIAARAGSGATLLLEAFFIFYFLVFYFESRNQTFARLGVETNVHLYAWLTLGILLF